MAIKLLDLIKGTEPAGILPGTTLNHVAALFHVPTGWSLPWTSPFGGSIDYGDLSLDVAVLGRDVVITSIGVRLWDLDFSDVADARRVARPRPRFKRSARLDLQGITGGMTRDDVRTWLGKREIGFREFENTHDAFEETWQIIANKNTLFSFCRSDAEPWLMNAIVFGRGHSLWPVANGVGVVHKV